MSFDLSWLWDLLNSIATTLNSWFATIWTQATNISNTGQGIFSGLLAFGSQLWDSIVKFGQSIQNGLTSAYNLLAGGIQTAMDTFGNWFNTAYTFLSNGVTWIGSQFYNIGNWVYNAIYTAYNWISNAIMGAWNALVSWFSGVATAIGTWWTDTTNTINSWWGTIILGFRAKIIDTVRADITIAGAWKAGERLLNPNKLSDIPYALFGMITAPLAGELIGAIINAVVPIPASTTYPLIPTIGGFSYTPPSLSIETPTEKGTPSPTLIGAPSSQPSGYGLPLDKYIAESETYSLTTASQDLSEVDTISVDVGVSSTDGELEMSISYEVAVA